MLLSSAASVMILAFAVPGNHDFEAGKRYPILCEAGVEVFGV